jgi:hypothetical protein
MAIKTGSQLAFQGGGKDLQVEHATLQFNGTDATLELPTDLSEIYFVGLTLIKPDANVTASGQAQQLEVLPVYTPSSGTIGAISADGVITPALTSAGKKVIAIGRAVEGSGTLDTDSRVSVMLIGRS